MKPQHGFTLVELMITAAVASIVAMAAGSMLVAAFREPPIQTQLFDRETSAYILIESLRKQVRTADYNQAALLNNGIKLINTGGEEVMFQQINDSLYHQRGNHVMPLIEGGIESFSVIDTNGILQCSLKMKPHLASTQTVTYDFAYAFRN